MRHDFRRENPMGSGGPVERSQKSKRQQDRRKKLERGSRGSLIIIPRNIKKSHTNTKSKTVSSIVSKSRLGSYIIQFRFNFHVVPHHPHNPPKPPTILWAHSPLVPPFAFGPHHLVNTSNASTSLSMSSINHHLSLSLYTLEYISLDYF